MMSTFQHNKIDKIFQLVGVTPGASICLQSSLKVFSLLGFSPESIIESLINLIGEKGTLIMPTYNFHSWTEHQFFDIRETPSEVGVLTEIFRKYPGVRRTKHPIHSLAVWGKLKDELCAIDATNSFGLDSVFATLEKHNVLYLTAGTDLSMPFLHCHYSEFVNGVGYRKEKFFSGNYVDENGESQVKEYSFDVKKDKFQSLISPVYEGHEDLYRQGVVHKIEHSDIKICFARSSEYHSAFIQFIKNNQLLFRNTA